MLSVCFCFVFLSKGSPGPNCSYAKVYHRHLFKVLAFIKPICFIVVFIPSALNPKKIREGIKSLSRLLMGMCCIDKSIHRLHSVLERVNQADSLPTHTVRDQA